MQFSGPLYDRLFAQLEAVRWTLGSIPFDQIDRDAVTADDLNFVRVNCCMELSSLYATRMFLRDFQAIPDFCQFISIWYYEEMKHYLVLREYLKVFDLAPPEGEIPALDVDLQPAPWSSTLAMHFVGELRLGIWYQRWSEWFQEPVLKRIYHSISEDEFRHANCYKLFMHKVADQDPKLLLDFAQMAKWMLYNPMGDKHPTTLRLNGPEQPSVKDLIPDGGAFDAMVAKTMTAEDEADLGRRVLAALSTLSGRKLTTLSELAAFTRELQRQTPQSPREVSHAS